LTDHRIPRSLAKPFRFAGPTKRRLTAEVPLVLFHDEEGTADVYRDFALALVDVMETMPRTREQMRLSQLALAGLEQSMQTAPDDVPALQALGYVLWLLGRKAEAMTAVEKVLALEPRQETALLYAAGLAAALGRTETALDYWRRLLAVNPYSAHYRHHLAKFHTERGQWREAAAECQEALKLNPVRLETRLLLVGCHLESGDRERAREEFQRVLALHPPNEQELRQAFAELLK
jgi:tetratricopeptide (TPR) repeat protein